MGESMSDYTLEQALAEMKQTTVGEIRDADIGRQMATAREYRRSMRDFGDKLTALATLNEHVAASCSYSLPRGGKRVTGPSIRFAELIAVCYGNLHVSVSIVSVDDKCAIVRGACLDLETNTLMEGDQRAVVHKKKSKAKPDEDDKQLAVARVAAIARRNAILATVPRALWEPILYEANRAAAGKGTMQNRREAALNLYAEFGATEDQVLAAFGRKGVEELTVDDLRHLRAMVHEIRSGERDVFEALQPLEPDKPRGAAKAGNQSALGEKVGAKAAETQPEPAEDYDPDTGEVLATEAEHAE